MNTAGWIAFLSAVVPLTATAVVAIISALKANGVAVSATHLASAAHEVAVSAHKSLMSVVMSPKFNSKFTANTGSLRTMYDAIGANAHLVKNVWRTGNLVAIYVAGNSFIWTPAERALFPPESLVTITLTASFFDADVLDVEPGGATPDQVHAWIAEKKRRGYFRPTIYCSKSTVPAVRTGSREFILGKDYDIWVAEWDGTDALPYPSAVAKQKADPGPYDISVVYDPNWPHRHATTPVPTPPPPPPPVPVPAPKPPPPPPIPQTGTQKGWHYCVKCKCLFWKPAEQHSHCAAGGTHESDPGEYIYSLPFSTT